MNKDACITDSGSKQMKSLFNTSGLLYHLSRYNDRSYVSEHILDKTQTLASDAFNVHTVNNFKHDFAINYSVRARARQVNWEPQRNRIFRELNTCNRM
jgi:hypothetical protein